MRIKLVKIGNSVGVRLPKSVIQTCGFNAEVDMEVKEKSVVLKVPEGGRTTWNEQFQNGIIQNPIKDKGEWEW